MCLQGSLFELFPGDCFAYSHIMIFPPESFCGDLGQILILKSPLGVQLFDVAAVDQTLKSTLKQLSLTFQNFQDGAWRGQSWRMYCRMVECIDSSNQAFERHNTFRIAYEKSKMANICKSVYPISAFKPTGQLPVFSTSQRPFFLRHSAIPRASIHPAPSCSPIDSTMPLSKPATLKNLPGCRGCRRFTFHDSRLQSGASGQYLFWSICPCIKQPPLNKRNIPELFKISKSQHKVSEDAKPKRFIKLQRAELLCHSRLSHIDVSIGCTRTSRTSTTVGEGGGWLNFSVIWWVVVVFLV